MEEKNNSNNFLSEKSPELKPVSNAVKPNVENTVTENTVTEKSIVDIQLPQISINYIETNVEKTVNSIDTLIKKKPVISGDFDTLVLSGGGVHGTTMLGSLQYAEDNFLLNKIHTFIGTSIGAIIGYLLAIGYSSTEIIVHLCRHKMFEKLKNFNIVAMMNGGGASSFIHIHEELEKLTIEKIGRLLTLKDLYTLFNKSLICVTYNLTQHKQEILKHETHPDLPCLIALRMSANIPLIFEKFKYTGDFYIDGGIYNNFPIDIGDQIGNKVLGILLYNYNIDSDCNKDTLEFILQMMFIPVMQNMLNIIEKASDKCVVVKLNPFKTSFFNFNLDTHTKLEMFSDGYSQMKEYWERV